MKMILLGLVLTFQYERFYSWAQAEKIIEESGIPDYHDEKSASYFT